MPTEVPQAEAFALHGLVTASAHTIADATWYVSIPGPGPSLRSLLLRTLDGVGEDGTGGAAQSRSKSQQQGGQEGGPRFLHI